MWQIIGAGAIGCLWAANLKISGQEVHLITRKPAQSNALYYQDLQKHKHHFTISSSQKLLNSEDPVLVCVKATQVKQAILTQRPYLGDNQIVILMHNGMGCAEQVQALLPNNPIICATTANASLLHSPFNIQQTGLGLTYLGAFNQPIKLATSLTLSLNNALNNTFWIDDIKQKLWLKLIINSCINPLTAIHQIKNGELDAPNYQEQIVAICKEAVAIANTEGIFFQPQPLFTKINEVIKATGNNYSSMNRDIFYHRKTENDYINGYLLEKARQFHLTAPTIEALYRQIQEHDETIADNEKRR
jgi:2-dehydropantoate 2-reductase